ncbi:MAG: hypothetical protein HND48_15845 [Chloroflexi bacterium]|nr:hypothetical protein [Chloroflexota bacterium]
MTGIVGLLVVVIGAVLGAMVGSLLKAPVIVIGSAFGGATAVVLESARWRIPCR